MCQKKTPQLVDDERYRTHIDHFTDHPFAIFDEAGTHVMEHIHQPNFHWISDDPEVMAILASEDMDDVLLASQQERYLDQIQQHRRHAAAVPPLNRNLRRNLRSRSISPGLVDYYEEQILSFIDHLKHLDGHGHYAADPEEMYLALDIADGYARWIVHIMCEYYQLVSFCKC